MPLRSPVVVENLVKRFGDFTAVAGISFEVRPGELFGLLGPNGAGKTTTLKILSGLLKPTAGRAWVAGYEVTRHPHQVKTRIGYMSQRFSLYRELTVLENLEFFRRVQGVDRNRLQQVIRQARLEPVLQVRVDRLSTGLRQKLALWCAFLHEPAVVFLDEPTAGADPFQRSEFWQTLRRQGISAIVTTHFMDEAEALDRLALMHRGRILAQGTPQELKQAFRKRWQLFAVEGPALRKVREALAQRPEVASVTPYGSKLHVRLPRDAPFPTLPELRGARWYPIQPTLEHVFFALVETPA